MSRAQRAGIGWVGLRALGLIWVCCAPVLAFAQDEQPEGPPAIEQTRPQVSAPSVDSTGALVQTRPSATVGGGRPAGGASAAAVPGGAAAGRTLLDYDAWERMAVRAEARIENTQSTGLSLESVRAQLVDWREALLGAQNANAARIATLRTQIAALGPIPADGETEAEEIAKRRGQLSDQLVRLQAPGIAAEEAYRRADGLIGEIDRELRDRQADELLRIWPAPINPGNWPAALGALSQLAVTLWDETATRWNEPKAQRMLLDNLPLIVLALAFAVGVLWRGRAWLDGLVARLQGHATARGMRIWSFLASLGLIVVPLLGVFALANALQLTGMLGNVGGIIAQALPGIAFPLFAAIWLGGRVFPEAGDAEGTARLRGERQPEGRILTSSFGLLLSVHVVLRVAFEPLAISDAATSVLTFPILVVAGSLLFRMGQLMRRLSIADQDDDRRGYGGRMIGLLARLALVIGPAGPLLAAVGYVLAAQALVFPAAISLGLVGVLFVLQRLIGDIYALVMREAEADHEALVPVLAGFVLTLATLPLFALIWGARIADLTELWTRFREGFTLGATKVSPTDFLLFAVIFGIGYGVTRVLQGALKATVLPRTGLDQGGQNAVVSGLGYVGIFLAGLIAINSTGIDLSGLAIVAGALSVGIGFGLQTVVSNFVSGIILLIERPVSEGDWIEVGGVQGIVKAISVRSTRIQTFDRSDVIVPNTDLIAGRVTNWTRFNLTGRLIVPVAVPFTSDSRKVERLLREIVEAQPMSVLNPPPLVVLMGFTGEAMQFEIRVILRDVNFSLSVRSDINHEIAARFATEGILFSNAHRDFLLKQEETDAMLALNEAELQAHEQAVATLLGPIDDLKNSPDPLRPVVPRGRILPDVPEVPRE